MSKKPTKQQKKEQQQTERVTQMLALSLLLVLLAGLLSWHAYDWVKDPNTLPIEIVRIDGDLKYLQRNELENAVASKVSGGFFNINLLDIQRQAQLLAWVDDVSIKRVWPNKLVMTIKEKVAMARWNDKQLVTEKGVIFSPPGIMPEGLPGLRGTNERAVEAVDRFKRERQRFAKLQLELAELIVTDRGAWSLHFKNGLKIAVGREDVDSRLDRFARYLGAISQFKGLPESVDLRYQHGIAVYWKAVEEQADEVNGEGAV